ncbi:MAG: hypothetical protein DI582_01335 [Azospirillum brasilense]|nr:MAG: hypothetical protein DI582_01335 [Azospirillum brasilense]
MRDLRRTMDEVGRTVGTGEALIGGHINGAEEARYRTRNYRTQGQANDAEGRYIISEHRLEAIRDGDFGTPVRRTAAPRQASYGQAQPGGYSQLPPEEYQRGSAPEAPVAARAAAPAAAQRGPVRPLVANERLIESVMGELGDAARAQTPAERDAALDRFIAVTNRIGKDTPIQSIGGELKVNGANGAQIDIPLPPRGRTFTITDMVTPYLRQNRELGDALAARIAASNGQTVEAPANQPQAPATGAPTTAAPATGAPATAAPSTGAPSTGAPSTGAPSTGAPAPATGATGALTAATGGSARTYSLRTNTDDMPKIAANQVADLQGRLVDAGFDLTTRRQADGKDGKYGPKTEAAVNAIAREAGVNPKDIDFTNAQDPDTVKFMQTLDARIASRGRAAAPAPVVPQGPTPEELAAQAERDRLAAEEARIPEAIRGTHYDPRVSATMSQAERDALARKGLHALDEIASENGARDPETLARKIREVQKDAGMLQSGEASPQTLAALGVAVAERSGLAGRAGNVYEGAQSQAEMNAAAAVGFHALDETAGITRNPEVLARKVREFERENNLTVDGRVDPAMLQALEQAVAARGGLTQVRGGTEVSANGGEPPASPTVQTNPQLQQTRLAEGGQRA